MLHAYEEEVRFKHAKGAMMHGIEPATPSSVVRILIISGIFLSVYAAQMVWGADPSPAPSGAPEPPAVQTACEKGYDVWPKQTSATR